MFEISHITCRCTCKHKSIKKNMKMTLRKLNLKKFTSFLLAAIAVTTFYSCSNDDDQNANSARLVVHMTDAPGDYDQVWVDVVDVRIKADASTGEEGWTSLGNVNAGVYDLLSLTGGVTQLLAEANVPAGQLGQIRLVLGNNNSVVINGESQPLSTPSAQQSGLKLMVNQNLEAGKRYEYLLDFNVDQSIVSAGSSGGYVLKPVIRLAAMEGTGIISGEIQPSLTQAVVRARNAANDISAYTDENGNFMLHGVPAGTYQITITSPASSGIPVKTMNNIVITSGQTLDLETIFLQ